MGTERARSGDLRWQFRVPPVLVPVPAATQRPLTGRRMVHHDPVQGAWVYELRAVTEPHQRDGSSWVGLLDEAEWYRSLRESEHLAVPRPFPLEQLWIEQRRDAETIPAAEPPGQGDIVASFRTRSLTTDLARPPTRWLRHLPDQPAVTGARAWQMTPEGPSAGWRIVGEPRRRIFEQTVNFSRGLDSLDEAPVGTVVPVCTEADWYQWRQTGQVPACRWPMTTVVWLE